MGWEFGFAFGCSGIPTCPFSERAPSPAFAGDGCRIPFRSCVQEMLPGGRQTHTEFVKLPTDHLASLRNESRIRGQA